MSNLSSKVIPITYKNGKLLVLDQRILPYEKKYLELKTYKDVIFAIKDMVVRGAPLIGITAAYGMALAAKNIKSLDELISIGEEIKQSRPTAINLHWAVDLILKDIRALKSLEEIVQTVEKRAIWIHEDDKIRCSKIGQYGAHIIKSQGLSSALTICNTGALATGGIGTAFAVLFTAFQENPLLKIYASETRPRQQGARLTTYEFLENDIECTLVPDTACGYLMKKGEIDFVIAGADRIAKNGDTANKIGTYQLAVLAKENNIPFYIAAPLSTFDLSINSGDEIPIEERCESEVTHINEKIIAHKKARAINPAFDVTPIKYIHGIITEKGILKDKETIQNAFNEAAFV